MIPKRLHFTWKTKDLPPKLQRYFDSFRQYHPDWEILLWTDESMRVFVAERYPQMLPTYDDYDHNIQRADIFRYMVLHGEGGVYSDLDVEALAPIDDLLDLDCFAGIEPFQHVGDHRRQAGIGYLISNAFMGSVAGHPFWQQMIDLAPGVAAQSRDIFLTTGPFFLLAAAWRAPADLRPVALLPELWSPQSDGGRSVQTSAEEIALVLRRFRVHRGTGRALVSHKWLTTWASWTSKYQHVIDRYHPNRVKWWLRSKLYPEVASVKMPPTHALYDDQRVEMQRTDKTVSVALHLPQGSDWNGDLTGQLIDLDYPRDKLSVRLYAAANVKPIALTESLKAVFGMAFEFIETDAIGAALHNLMLSNGAARADCVLFVDGSLAHIPTDALVTLANSGPELVTATLPRASRPEAYRYGRRLNFRDLYKAGARSGVLSPDRGGRHEPREWPAFRLLPVDGLSARFLLVDSRIVAKGARFAETPYKFHLDSEGLTLMAKDLGFEAAIRNDILVE